MLPKPNDLLNTVKEWSREDYFSDEALNFHTLWDFQKDPKLFAAGFFAVKETTDAMRQGTQFHELVLEGDEVFNANNALWTPPVNEKTGKPYGAGTKNYADARAEWESANPGKTGYTPEEWDQYARMRDAIINHPTAGGYLFPDEAETASELKFKGEYAPGWAAKGSIDRYDAELGIIDLKTCAEIERFDGYKSFEKTCMYGGYIEQLAFYQTMFFEIVDPRPILERSYIPVHIVGIEKKEPFRCQVITPDAQTMEQAREHIKRLIEDYVFCVTKQFWPGRYDEEKTIFKDYDRIARDYVFAADLYKEQQQEI